MGKLAFTLVTLAASGATAAEAIFVVRHAEKLDDSQDPPLSKAGEDRALRLAKLLDSAGLTAIHVTEYARNARTAEPLARARGLTVKVHPARDTAGLIAKLKAEPGRLLVVGHSNTVPAIVAAFDPTQKIAIGDRDYDNLFVIVGATVIRLRF